jgi:hypothetical protein
VVLGSARSDDTLYRTYRDAGLVVDIIGDVKKVRNLRNAVTDGADRGLTLDSDLQLNANRSVIANLPTELRK